MARNSYSKADKGKWVSKLFDLPGLALGALLIIGGLAIELAFSEPHPQIVLLSHIMLEFGGVLCALAILHMLYEHRLFERILTAIRSDTERNAVLNELGVVQAHKKLEDHRVIQEMMTAKHIRVLKTFFLESAELRAALERLLRATPTVKVELYLLKPESALLEARSKSIDPNFPLHGQTHVHHALQIFKTFVAGGGVLHPESHITLFDEWPGSPLIQVGDRIFLGYYMIGGQSPSTPWLEVRSEGELYRTLEEQFNKIVACRTADRLTTAAQFASYLPQPR